MLRRSVDRQPSRGSCRREIQSNGSTRREERIGKIHSSNGASSTARQKCSRSREKPRRGKKKKHRRTEIQSVSDGQQCSAIRVLLNQQKQEVGITANDIQLHYIKGGLAIVRRRSEVWPFLNHQNCGLGSDGSLRRGLRGSCPSHEIRWRPPRVPPWRVPSCRSRPSPTHGRHVPGHEPCHRHQHHGLEEHVAGKDRIMMSESMESRLEMEVVGRKRR